MILNSFPLLPGPLWPEMVVSVSSNRTVNFFMRLLLSLWFESFSHQLKLMIFYWSLSEKKSSQVSRTFLSILADLSNALVWIVSTRPFISKSSSPFALSVPMTNRVQQGSSLGLYPTFSSLKRLLLLTFGLLTLYQVLSGGGSDKHGSRHGCLIA